jgi:beta-barrel assembly-enhancing protease
MFKPSMSEQVRLGKQVAAELRKKEKDKVVPANDERVRLLRAIGEKIVAQIPADERKKKPWEYSFDLIESKEVNAFALPGGPVFFYSELFKKFKTEDEIAAVIGHELTHVREEHWAYQEASNRKRTGLLTLGLLIFKANQDTANLVGIGDTLIFELPYSRDHESRADAGGFKLVDAAGFNPQGMVDVFTMFSKLGGSKPPEFISDHPDDRARIKKLSEMLKKSGKQYPSQRPLPASMIAK